jgi:hypothetical protein
MEHLKEYAQNAQSCRDAASKARTAAERDHLFQMAQRWEELARQRAAYRHLEDALAELLNHNKNSHNGGASA